MSYNKNKNFKIPLSSNRKVVWFISTFAIFISILGFVFSTINPSIGYPLRPGLDFTGGTQIKLERNCIEGECTELYAEQISQKLKKDLKMISVKRN